MNAHKSVTVSIAGDSPSESTQIGDDMDFTTTPNSIVLERVTEAMMMAQGDQ